MYDIELAPPPGSLSLLLNISACNIEKWDWGRGYIIMMDLSALFDTFK
jgi:hypothetical protein